MKQEKQPLSDRLYGALLRLFPFDFRSDFGDQMEQTFREQRTEVERLAGRTGVMRLWWDAVVGIFSTAPREHVSMLGQDIRYALRMMRKNKGYTGHSAAGAGARHRRQYSDRERHLHCATAAAAVSE